MGKGQNGIDHQIGFIQRLSFHFSVILRGVKDEER